MSEGVRRALPYALLLLLFALLVLSVQDKSPTLDEQNHIARGLAYLSTGDLRLSQEHPPGVNAWAAWPLLLDARVRLPLDSPSWENAEWYGFADRLLWRDNDHPQAMVFAARVPVMWLALLLGALACRWARELGGPWAGLLSLGFLVLDPNLLAHGRLATNDLGVTCLTLAAAYALWRALRLPSPGRWAVAGLALGLAQLSKFSALVLGPVTLLLVALAAIGDLRGQADRGARLAAAWRWVGGLLLAICAAAVVIWAGYAFSWGPIAALGGLRGPMPAYWDGIAAILRRTGGGTPAFLLGQVSEEGWWAYFPVAFALKTPLPTLIALLAALAAGLWRALRPGRAWPSDRVNLLDALCLFLPAAGFWAMAVGGSFNIGYRHILPSLPLLTILAARQWAPYVRSARRRANAAALALLLWLGAGTVVLAPHYLAFFNLFAGGPEGGYRCLVDSNLDWGQDLPGLVRYVRRNDIERVYLSWFGAAHPEAYDLSFHPLPGFWRFRGEAGAYGFNPYAPAPGVYAISATNLQGVALADRDLYAWFRQRQPDAQVGHSILIYRLEGDLSAGRDAVVLGVPASALDGPERDLLQRAASVRRYNPETGLILPGDVSAAEETWFVAPIAQGGEIVRQGPSYVVARGAVPPSLSGARGPAFGSAVLALRHGMEETCPSGGETLRVTVIWAVLEPPHRAAVSFAHLLDGEGRYVAGWDGLTAPATCWLTGDVIVQHYDLPLPERLSPGSYAIEIGWYDPESGKRWPAQVEGVAIGDRWLLPELEVCP